jgi:transposase
VTDAIVCDGMRTAVTKADRYEPVPNATYLEMATHYQMTVLPARPYHPRDKAWTTDYTSWWIGNEPVMEQLISSVISFLC